MLVSLPFFLTIQCSFDTWKSDLSVLDFLMEKPLQFK